MIDEIFQKRKRRHTGELNIVPILDMLTTIIFFLLMSTSFMAYTKITLPPSATVNAPASDIKPLSPRLTLVRVPTSGRYDLGLSWNGATPGSQTATITSQNTQKNPDADRSQIFQEAKKLIGSFSAAHPAEKVIRIALSAQIPYQHMVSLMDAAIPHMPDVVLMSPAEALPLETLQ